MGESLEAEIKRLQGLYWSEADPDGLAFVCLADAYRRSGDFREGLRILRDGLRRHPGLSSGHVVRGWIHAERGDAKEAEGAFRAALELDPGNISALRGLGDMLALRGELTEALEVFRSLLPLDPLDGDLPRRIAGVEAALEVIPSPLKEQVSPEPDEGGQPLWDDPEAVAEELDWASAALQPDRSQGWKASPAGTAAGAPPWRPPGGGEAPGERPSVDDALVTRTMGEIFLRQGLLDRATEVFRRLAARDPEDREVREKLEQVNALRAGKITESAGSSPAREEAGREGASRAVLPIQELLADPILGPEALAPDRILPVSELAPAGTISVDDLAPDTILPVAALAPNLVMPMDELAPDAIVRIETLAPDSSPEDPVLDAFEAWLDKLQ